MALERLPSRPDSACATVSANRLNGTPHAIAQTRDGYLWIGTRNGVLRFDGVRFVPWTPPAGKQLPSQAINTLLGARDGSLWIATDAGVSHWTNGHLVNYSEDGMFDGFVEDQHGGVWVTRYRFMSSTAGLVCQVGDKSMRCYGEAEGLKVTAATELADDGRGGFWIVGGNGTRTLAPGLLGFRRGQRLADSADLRCNC